VCFNCLIVAFSVLFLLLLQNFSLEYVINFAISSTNNFYAVLCAISCNYVNISPADLQSAEVCVCVLFLDLLCAI